jgi:hypothetical protein
MELVMLLEFLALTVLRQSTLVIPFALQRYRLPQPILLSLATLPPA